MARLYSNNFSTTLDGAITDVATTITLTSVTGLPAIGSGDTCILTLDDNTNVEIIEATAVAGLDITVVRAQEGTSGTAFADLDEIELRTTADSYNPDTIISDKTLTAATISATDKVLIQDTDDTDNLKTVTTQAVADLKSLSGALDGDINLAGNQITSPDGTDLIDIPNGSVDIQTASTSRLDITDSGVRLGAANARVTTVLDEDDMTSDSPTALSTQQAIKSYTDAGDNVVLVSSATASASATVEFTGLSSTYKFYILSYVQVVPATNSQALLMRTSTDGGSTYASTSGDYSRATVFNNTTTSTPGGASGTSETAIIATGAISNTAANGGGNGVLHIYNHATTDGDTHFTWAVSNYHPANGLSNNFGAGSRNAVEDVDAIQLLMQSGNIASGEFYLHGVK